MRLIKTATYLCVLFICLLSPIAGEGGTTYPLLDPRFAYAAPRAEPVRRDTACELRRPPVPAGPALAQRAWPLACARGALLQDL